MNTNLINEFWNSRKNCPANHLHENKHYGSYDELIQDKGFGKKKVTSPYTGTVYDADDYPEDYFDYKVTPIRCIRGIDFDPYEEGPVECNTAVECKYHGNTIVISLPACTTATFVETYHSNGSYWDPDESDGYFELSEDIDIDDDYGSCFSSVEAYEKACKEWEKKENRYSASGKWISLSEYLSEHDDMHTIYTVDGDSYEDVSTIYTVNGDSYEDIGGIITHLDDEFYEDYLKIVCNNGFEAEIGDKSVIDAYKAKLRNEEDEAEARWNREHGYDF